MAGADGELAGIGESEDECEHEQKTMSGSVRSSAGLVWRHQRLLWWLFAVNAALAFLSSLPLRAALPELLDRSMESVKFVSGFDVGTLVLLLEQPESPMRSAAPGAVAAAIFFLLYTLWMDGGVVAVYLQDRKLSGEELVASCVGFFGRMVRLAFCALVPFGALMAAGAAMGDYAGKLSDNAPQERLGFLVNVASKLVIVLVALLVRLWFDLAQARMVHGDGRSVFRELRRSFKPAFRSGLYWQYIGIAVFAAASMAVGVWVWTDLPHGAMGASLAVLELVTVVQIATRLWMKAASARWVALQTEATAIGGMEAAAARVVAEKALEPPQAE
jgi:hypothetical protein